MTKLGRGPEVVSPGGFSAVRSCVKLVSPVATAGTTEEISGAAVSWGEEQGDAYHRGTSYLTSPQSGSWFRGSAPRDKGICVTK